MSKVTNTTAQDPTIMLMEMLSGGAPSGAIERQGARGQRELVNAQVLPTDGLKGPCWAAMGIVIKDKVNGDEMFTEVELPAGWSKKSTDHSMWSNLLDAKGRVRARIFYNAAFYDRSARIQPELRFIIDREWGNETSIILHVKDGDSIAFSTAPVAKPAATPEGYKNISKIEEAARAQCEQWLIDNGYPDYRNAAAYWD